MKNRMRPVHPGEVLREEFLVPLGLSANRLSQRLHVPTNRISMLLAEKRSLTADTALRLAKCFQTSPEFWLNLQQAYELRLAEKDVAEELQRIRPYAKSA